MLDLPLGGRPPTQLLSLSSVCLKTPVIHPHSATLRQSHFSTSHPRRICLGAAGTGRGGLNGGGSGGGLASQGAIFVTTIFQVTAAFSHIKSCYYTSRLHVINRNTAVKHLAAARRVVSCQPAGLLLRNISKIIPMMANREISSLFQSN